MPNDKIPRVKKGPLALLTWFKTMTERYGDHPRLLADCPEVLEKAGIERIDVTESVLLQATRECLPLAKEHAARHNAAEARGEAIGTIAVSDEFWLTGRHSDPLVRRKQAEKQEEINQRPVESDAPEPYNPPDETQPTPPEQETEDMATATATKSDKKKKSGKPKKDKTNPKTPAAETPAKPEAVKSLKVSQKDAVALLKDMGMLNADQYDADKLREKLQRYGKAGPADDAEPSDKSKALLKKLAIAVNDGTPIEVTGGKEVPAASTNGYAPKAAGKKPAAKKKPKADGDKRGKKGMGKGGMSLLDAAAKLFGEDNTPRTPKELIADILKKKYWGPTNSPTPFDTVKVAMIQEMRKKGDESRFCRPEPGKYALAK